MRAWECVSRGKLRATADQIVDVEISDPSNRSPLPGPNPSPPAARAQSRKEAGTGETAVGMV